MGIYTRTGDEGEASHLSGKRARKSEPLFAAVGDVDELNASLGWCIRFGEQEGLPTIDEPLQAVQAELFAIGARLSGGVEIKLPGDEAVSRMERQIDAATAACGQLTHFILPAGAELACRLHMARAICRRAERSIVAAADAGADVTVEIIRYVNRLSDLLFAMARLANKNEGVRETTWP